MYKPSIYYVIIFQDLSNFHGISSYFVILQDISDPVFHRIPYFNARTAAVHAAPRLTLWLRCRDSTGDFKGFKGHGLLILMMLGCG